MKKMKVAFEIPGLVFVQDKLLQKKKYLYIHININNVENKIEGIGKHIILKNKQILLIT